MGAPNVETLVARVKVLASFEKRIHGLVLENDCGLVRAGEDLHVQELVESLEKGILEGKEQQMALVNA